MHWPQGTRILIADSSRITCQLTLIISNWYYKSSLKWAPQSSDLNPLEPLRDVVEQEIHLCEAVITVDQNLWRIALCWMWPWKVNGSPICQYHTFIVYSFIVYNSNRTPIGFSGRWLCAKYIYFKYVLPLPCFNSYLIVSFWLCAGYVEEKYQWQHVGERPFVYALILIRSGGSCLPVEACN